MFFKSNSSLECVICSLPLVCDAEFFFFVYKDLLCSDLKREAMIEMTGKSVFLGKE